MHKFNITYLGCVGVHSVRGPIGHRASGVPNHQFLIIRHGPEQGLMQEMPGHVLNHRGVSGEDSLSVDNLVLLGSRIDIPQTDGVVIRGGEEMAIEVRIP